LQITEGCFVAPAERENIGGAIPQAESYVTSFGGARFTLAVSVAGYDVGKQVTIKLGPEVQSGGDYISACKSASYPDGRGRTVYHE